MAVVVAQNGDQLTVGATYRISFYQYETIIKQLGIWNISVQLTAQSAIQYLGDLAFGYQSAFEGAATGLSQSTTVKWLGAKVARCDPGITKIPGVATSTNGGGGTGVSLPGQVSGIISWYASTRRSGRGRSYIPFPAANMVDATTGFPVVAYQSYLQDIVLSVGNTQTVFGGLGGTMTGQQIVFHRAKKGPPPVPSSYDPVFSTKVPLMFATQRKRGNYGRENSDTIPF